MAVVDMSDNANKMGTSMEDIQNAYQGFAKQNYTMLDNLKLGYGGTKTEMERLLSDAEKLTGQKYDISNLSDVYNAVHAIQENLDIAGTTAKEAATTFSGSFNSMKAAAQNLLGNLAVGGDVKTAMSQLVGSAVTFAFDNAIPMIGNIFSALPTAIATAIETGAPKVKAAGASIVKSLSSGLMDLLPDSMKKVTTSVSNVASSVKQAGSGVGEVASQVSKYVGYTVQSGDTLSAIAKQYKTTYQDLAAYNNIPDPNKIFTGQSIQVPNMEASQQPSQTEAASPQPETTTTTSLNMDNPIISSFANLAAASLGMVQTAFSSLKTAVSAAAGTVVSVLPGITNAVTAVVTGITPLIQTATDIFVAAQPIVVSVINSLSGAVQRLAPPVSTAVNKVGKAIEKLVQTVSNHMGVFETAVSAIVPVISTSISVLGTVFEAAGNVISPALDAILSIVESVMGAIAPVVSDAWSMISSAFESAGSFLLRFVSRFVVINMPSPDEETLNHILKSMYPTLKESAAEQFVGLFLDLQTKAQNSEISAKALDLRGLLAAIGLMKIGLSPIRAIHMGVGNKSFDLFEREMVEDIIMTRIPSSLEAAEVFED